MKRDNEIFGFWYRREEDLGCFFTIILLPILIPIWLIGLVFKFFGLIWSILRIFL